MFITVGLVCGLILAFGLIKQVQIIVERKRSMLGYLLRYGSIFLFLGLFYFNPENHVSLGIGFGIGMVVGITIGIVAKQRTMR